MAKSVIRSGLAKAELAVILLVVGLLATISLPALEMAREAARKSACQANLRQIGQALHSYYDSYNVLPPAAYWSDEQLDIARFLRKPRTADTVKSTRQNWVQLLLPHLGQDALAEEFVPYVSVTAPENETGRTTGLSMMSCPSDSYNRSDNPYILEFSDGTRVRFARGNYGINGGTQNFREFPGWSARPRPAGFHYTLNAEKREFQWWGNGVAGINKCFSFQEFANGLSTTVAVDELRAGVASIDPRGVWALGQIGGSVTWAHGIYGDDAGPNNPWYRSDDVLGGDKIHEQLGRESLDGEGMPCCPYCKENEQVTSRSKHPGGVNLLMMDGSVRFVVNEVSQGLWHVMHSRETPEVFLADVFEERVKGPDARVEAAAVVDERTVAPSKSPGSTFINSIGMQFTVLPAAEYMMGLHEEGNMQELPPEVPTHLVRITRNFCLGTYEVTQREYERVTGENPSWHSATGAGKDQPPAGGYSPRFPVEMVTWYDADEFCRRLSALSEEVAVGRVYRLPTEAEWEYACRDGQTTFTFNEKRSPNDKSGENGMLDSDTALPIVAVGSYPPSKFGLYDMRGNVYEWVADWYARDYYSWSRTDDPPGPLVGYHKIPRGTNWIFTGQNCKINYGSVAPWYPSQFIGFRIVCEFLASR